MARLTATLDLPGADGPILVHALRGREAVSEAFRYQVDFSTAALAPDDARGAVATVHIQDSEGHQRYVSGLAQSLSVAANNNGGGASRMRAVLVPIQSLISYRRGFRIFQDQDVTEIVATVFRDAGLPDKAFQWKTSRGYRKRAYCVQYDETEWAFVCRILEDEGIWFAFDQTASGHVMVFADDSTTARPLEPQELGFRFDAGGHGNQAFVWGWRKRSKLSVGKVAMRDYDQMRPSLDMNVSAEARNDPYGSVREWYEYPGGYGDPQYGKRLAQVRLEELQTNRVTGRAKTNAIWVQPGRVLTLVSHPLDDGDHFVRAIDWTLRIDAEQGRGPLVDTGEVSNVLELETIPKLRMFRPPRQTPKPKVVGLQSALVTGPAGEEIHCDPQGRIKVQFAWDKKGTLDDKTSCWIRVAQPQAPGAFLLPRVGWEVLVEFIEGDPDRPLCQGRMFNPKFMPVVALPDNKTMTFHRSDASPGGGGVNAWAMDDAIGKQHIALHAENAYRVSVGNDKVASTGHDEQLAVAGDRTETIGGDETFNVAGNSDLRVGADDTVTVSATRKIAVDGHINNQVKSNLTITVGAASTVQVGSPAAALLSMAESAAAAAVVAGAGTNATAQIQAAIAGPALPAIEEAKAAVGTASQYAGPAAGLLGPEPGAALMAAGEGLSSIIPDPEAIGAMATGAALTTAVTSSEGANDAGATGTGHWAVTVGGNVVETVGGLAALNTAAAALFTIGAASTETIGSARIEIIAGSKLESTGTTKLETIGGALVQETGSLLVESGGSLTQTVGGAVKQVIKGSHAITAAGTAKVTTTTLELNAAESLTLTCGLAQIVLNKDGIAIKGTDITIKNRKKLRSRGKVNIVAAQPGAGSQVTTTNSRIPHRKTPRIENGNAHEGWVHIDARHVAGTASGGDLFPAGTTRMQIEAACVKVVKKGTRCSLPSRQIQRFEKRTVVNGKRMRLRVVVDSDDDNRVITAFPVESE
jgi:type VI secretion system secreted protein VgrG